MLKLDRCVSGFDLHWPKADRPTVRAMLDFIEVERPKIIVLGGDQFDNECISHHTRNKPYYRARSAYLNDQRGFESDFLNPLEKVLFKDCEKIWITGNHDDWEFQLVESNPELEGLIDRPAALRLAERGWKVVPIGRSYRHGKLSWLHGEWLTGIGNQAGVYPAKKLVDVLATNAVAGHTHAAQAFTRVSPASQSQKWMGYISPILGKVNPTYMKNRPCAWVNGFNVTEFQENGNFNHYPIVVSGGSCIYGGRRYGKK